MSRAAVRQLREDDGFEELGQGSQRLLAYAEAIRLEDLNPHIQRVFGEKSAEGMDEALLQRALQAVGMAVHVEHNLNLTDGERANREKLGTLSHPELKVLATALPERLFRTTSSKAQWLALMEVVGNTGIPDVLPFTDRAALSTASSPIIGKLAPVISIAMAMARRHVQKQVGGFVDIFKDGRPENVIDHLEKRRAKTGVGYEANLVTESARTNGEAKKNIEWYKGAVRSGARRIAIKPTSVVSFSDSAVGQQNNKRRMIMALQEIFEEAERFQVANPGREQILSVDSERSDIIRLVRDALIEASRDFPKIAVRLAVQAYLSDSEKTIFDPLLEESARRVSDGGEAMGSSVANIPYGSRLVNGANQLGEECLASSMGWSGTPLVSGRAESHGNYFNLLNRAKDPIKEGKFELDIAGMNLVTAMDCLIQLARVGVLAAKNRGRIALGMLRGMTGPEIFRYLKAEYDVDGYDYSPVIPLDKIVELFKYYLRRIDEIAKIVGPEMANYLPILTKFGVDSPEFAETQVKGGIIAALEIQNRTSYPLEPGVKAYRGEHEPVVLPESLDRFKPVPFIAPGALEDSNWIDEVIGNCESRTDTDAENYKIPWESSEPRKVKKLRGPTRLDLCLMEYELATVADVDKAFEIEKEHREMWMSKSEVEKRDTLKAAVLKMREKRAALDEALMMNVGKSISESDAEVNEAMDFINLERLFSREWEKRDNLEFGPEGDGVAVVICPKNFPQAIPVAHIIGRLMNGYKVIVKPSGGEDEETVMATYEAVKCLWDAGIPKSSLVFLPCDNDVADYMGKKAERIGFTGSTAIAKKIRKQNPSVDIIAETGGTNFMYVDSTTDLKAFATAVMEAICPLSGQKCSKPIMIVADKDVDMQELNEHLLGQLGEMHVGTALASHVDVTPLSKQHEPGDTLYELVMNCMDGEEWLEGKVSTGLYDEHGNEVYRPASGKPEKMGRPGIRIIKDPKNFDFSKLKEIFASIVTVTQIDGGIEKMIDILKKTNGNLTGSVFSQDRKTIWYAINNWPTGNLNFNRKCTAAMAHVGFGDGVGCAHEGAHGAKTGTMEWRVANGAVKRKPGKHAKYEKAEIENDEFGLKFALEGLEGSLADKSSWPSVLTEKAQQEIEASIHAGYSYLYEYQKYFSKRRPAPYQTIGQYDWIESHKIGPVLLRINENDSIEDILGKIFATIAAGNELILSVPKVNGDGKLGVIEGLLGNDRIQDYFKQKLHLVLQTDQELAEFIKDPSQNPWVPPAACISYARRSNVPKEVFAAAADASLHVDCREVTGDGRVDMLHHFRQQSYCWVYNVAGDTSYEELVRQNHPEKVPYLKEIR